MITNPRQYIQFHETIEGKTVILNISPKWYLGKHVTGIRIWKKGEGSNSGTVLWPGEFLVMNNLDYKPMIRWL